MSDEPGYRSPQAFRRALTDMLTATAAGGRWSLQELQRQFACDRLLTRLYCADRDWVVKGATALIARRIAVRSTIDIDIYRGCPTDEADEDLRAACLRDLGDWFSFALGPGRPVNDGAGLRIRVDAHIGATLWSQFHVDLVGSDMRMTGQPDEVDPIAKVEISHVRQGPYLAYPIADHVADKVCAILQRYGPSELPSTRFKDLVDLATIVASSRVEAGDQLEALRSEARRRRLVLPARFGVPDMRLWEDGYIAEAKRSTLTVARDLREALVLVGSFVDPVLAGTAGGHWEPSARLWTGLTE